VKITKGHLRRIIKEELRASDLEIHLYLSDIADSARKDGLDKGAIKLLLQDEFMDNFGSYADIKDYETDIEEISSSLSEGRENKMKITKRQLRRIIKEEKAKLLRESVADMASYQDMFEEAAMKISDQFQTDMMSLFDENPEAFEGSSRLDWDQQVVYATQELETGISSAIEKVLNEIEMNLHDGQYFDDRP